jgi:hypothetical protein
VIRNIPPDEVVPLVRKCFDEFPWSRRLRVVGIGRDAVIEVLTTDLVACEEVIALVGPRVAGYPLKARRVADE